MERQSRTRYRQPLVGAALLIIAGALVGCGAQITVPQRTTAEHQVLAEHHETRAHQALDDLDGLYITRGGGVLFAISGDIDGYSPASERLREARRQRRLAQAHREAAASQSEANHPVQFTGAASAEQPPYQARR